MVDAVFQALRDKNDTRTPEQVEFLQALVRAATDNPPGDCHAAAELAADRLSDLGFEVERHTVPAELVRDHGMISVTNLIIRRRFGDGPHHCAQCPWRRGTAG